MVPTLPGHELIVATPLHDLSVLDDQDEIRPADGGEAVSDDKGCPVSQEILKTFLNEGLALRVEAGGGLIQDQDPWVCQDGSGDGDALTLSS